MLQEVQNLVIRNAGNGTDKDNILVLMEIVYYCNTLFMKHHLSISAYQKIDSNGDKRVFNNLKLLTEKKMNLA